MAFAAYERRQADDIVPMAFLWVVACALFVAMAILAQPHLRFALGLSGAIVVAVNLVLLGRKWIQKRNSTTVSRALGAMIARGPHQQYLSDALGIVLASNSDHDARGKQISTRLKDVTADADGLISELLQQARQDGKASNLCAIRNGRLRIHVAEVAQGVFQWQIERDKTETLNANASGVPRLPMLTAGRRDSILFMNAAAREIWGGVSQCSATFLANKARNLVRQTALKRQMAAANVWWQIFLCLVDAVKFICFLPLFHPRKMALCDLTICRLRC